MERGDTLTILAEACRFDDRRGRIVAFDVQGDRVIQPPREVLRCRCMRPTRT